MKRIGFPILVGLLGTLVLVSLGVWQVQRLQWKEAVLADITARISAAPVDLPREVNREADMYLPVRATGVLIDQPLRMLVSVKIHGAGYRLISVFETNGRRVLLDRGYIGLDDATEPPSGQITVVGNLHWPDETDGFTPEADGDLWFARDVAKLAAHLKTEEILIVAREVSPPQSAMTPLPVDTDGIPNDHLEYAITWFSLAVIWLLMTGYWLRRNRVATNKA